MKTTLLTFLVFLTCSSTLIAQNNSNENTTQIGYERVGQLLLNSDTTAVIGNDAMLVDVGYEYVKKSNITSFVKSVNIKDLQNDAFTSIGSYLRFRVPGYSGNELIVIDGQTGGSLSDVTPSVIKSIQLLQGASANIYGQRGFNGVLVIDTK